MKEQPKKNKRGNAAAVFVLLGVLAALTVVFGGLYLKDHFSSKTFDIGGKTDSGDPIATSGSSYAPTLLVNAKDQYNDTLLAGTYTLYLNGKKSSGTLGTAQEVTKGDQYEIVFDDASHHVGTDKGTIARDGKTTLELPMSPNSSALTTTFYNAAGTAASAQALGISSKEYVTVRLQAPANLVFGNPKSEKPMIGCFDYNTTELRMIKVQGGASVAVPMQYRGTVEECWTLPFTSLADGQKIDFQPYVEASTSVNPTQDATMYILDGELYTATVNDGTKKVGDRVWGYESDSGSDIGAINPTVTLDFS